MRFWKASAEQQATGCFSRLAVAPTEWYVTRWHVLWRLTRPENQTRCIPQEDRTAGRRGADGGDGRGGGPMFPAGVGSARAIRCSHIVRAFFLARMEGHEYPRHHLPRMHILK